jgi:hypothetical protein
MTPFELALDSTLQIEGERFYNQWLFKWYGMTYEGGKTDVEDFHGGRICYSGIVFGYQPQQIYWQAIDRYLMLKVHEIFQRWEIETKEYPKKVRLVSITGVERTLGRFVTTVIQRALETDQRLRKVSSALPAGTGGGRARSEVTRLAEAHRALVEEEIKNAAVIPVLAVSGRQKFENFLSSHKGILGLLGLLFALIFGLYRIFVG